MKTNRPSSQRVHFLMFAVILLTSFLAFVIPGCDGGGGSSSSSDSHTGTLAVSMTDAPACGFDAVNVTVNKVRIHQNSSATENDSGWAEIILDPARKINLLDLSNGALIELGETPLAAGHYTQLRLVLAENSGSNLANSVTPTGTVDAIGMKTPSAMQSGLKLINEFDVIAGERVDLLLDFDACKSVVMRGNGDYLLKPVIRVIPFIVNGIEGYVTPAEPVTVSAQRSGEVVRSTVPNAEGKFYISHLAPNSYDVVISADGHATAVVSGVPVASTTSTTVISTKAEPITLTTSESNTISGTITLNPPSPTAVAIASAKQTFPAGPTVTVQAQTVDLLSNAYTLTLPTAAPLLGAYGSGTLPLTLTAQNALAGLYSVEAAAPGYQTQVFSKDIAAADAIQDFILTP